VLCVYVFCVYVMCVDVLCVRVVCVVSMCVRLCDRGCVWSVYYVFVYGSCVLCVL